MEIVVFERGLYTSYSACGIPYYLGGLFDDADRLIARTPEEFRQAKIDVRTRSEVTAIDLAARRLTVRQLDERREVAVGFDQLVYATGAEAVAPPVPGAELIERCAPSMPPSASSLRWAAKMPITPSSSVPATSAWRWPRRWCGAA